MLNLFPPSLSKASHTHRHHTRYSVRPYEFHIIDRDLPHSLLGNHLQMEALLLCHCRASMRCYHRLTERAGKEELHHNIRSSYQILVVVVANLPHSLMPRKELYSPPPLSKRTQIPRASLVSRCSTTWHQTRQPQKPRYVLLSLEFLWSECIVLD